MATPPNILMIVSDEERRNGWPAIPTIGSLLADQGYYSAYLGKWP